VNIETAGLGAVEGVCALLRGQYAEHEISISDDVLVRAVQGLVGEVGRGVILVAREGEALLGVAVLATTWTLEHGGLVAWLDELYVVPARRGNGIGEALLDAALSAARGVGALAIELEVEESHSRASHLYERAGFSPLNRARWSLRL